MWCVGAGILILLLIYCVIMPPRGSEHQTTVIFDCEEVGGLILPSTVVIPRKFYNCASRNKFTHIIIKVATRKFLTVNGFFCFCVLIRITGSFTDCDTVIV